MKIFGTALIWILLSILAHAPVRSQPMPPGAAGRGVGLVNAAKSADEAWGGLLDLARPKPAVKQTTLRAPAIDEMTATEKLIQASHAAKAFYDRFPNDARVAEAQKTEVVLALQSVQQGAAHYKATAFAKGSAYRADKKQSDRDRFDVAFAMEGIVLAETLKGKRFIDDGPNYERLADGLHAELGDTPEVFGLYVSIVRTTDTATSTRVAAKLVSRKQTPDWAKRQAQTALDRSQLLGQPLDLKLTTIGGGAIDLAQPVGRPTVLYFWHSSGGPRDFAALDHFKPQIAVDARWLYVGLGGEPPKSDRPMAGSAFADTHCFESAQGGKPSTSYLKVQQTPYAMVLDSAGRLVGYGPPETIGELLQKAKR